jgi:GWxTD domain-containing protein
MSWLDTPIAAALARALMHFLWEGALIGALLFVVLLALRRATAQSRYVAACAAMAAMIASFAVTAIEPESAEPALSARVTVAASWLRVTGPAEVGPPPKRPFSEWTVALWLVGVTFLIVRHAGGWWSARRMTSRGVVAADEYWAGRLDELRRRMGIPHAVALVESALAATPSVMGWIRPVILAPAGWLMGLPGSQAEAVLLHELAHIRRHDYLVNLLQSVIEDLLFYHPAVWWVGRVMRRERENCCDDVVLAMGGDRRNYARTLATLERFRSGEPALAASGGSLADRIRRLARPPAGPRASAVPLISAMVLVCAGAVVLPAWQTPAPVPAADPTPTAIAEFAAEPAVPAAAADPVPAPAPAPQAPPAAQADPYRKWLTEDVAYIIQDDEREAFNRLRSAEEKEHFIEQFWARRGNDVKEEHYRRIAYANDRFADGQVAGWKTDRGRIYITMGPPDEKEVHPNGEAGSPPYEEWMYRQLQGTDRVMKFVDQARDGQYLLQVPGGRLNGWVRVYPKPNAVSTAMPPVQANGDYLFAANRIVARVGVKGATLISVDASEARITLNRVTRHDGGGEVLLQESTVNKLITLEPGEYRVQAEMSGPGVITQEQLRALTARLTEMSQTYTSAHPKILSLQNQIRNLEAMTRYNGSVAAELRFRVP